MMTKTNGKQRLLTLGGFIAGAYGAWGRRRAKRLVRLDVNRRLFEFRGPQRFVISED
jgi:hypothetical protein